MTLNLTLTPTRTLVLALALALTLAQALRDPAGVRVYRDLSQAADELAAMAAAL